MGKRDAYFCFFPGGHPARGRELSFFGHEGRHSFGRHWGAVCGLNLVVRGCKLSCCATDPRAPARSRVCVFRARDCVLPYESWSVQAAKFEEEGMGP